MLGTYSCLSVKCHVDSVYLYLDHFMCVTEREWGVGGGTRELCHDDSQLIQLFGTQCGETVTLGLH